MKKQCWWIKGGPVCSHSFCGEKISLISFPFCDLKIVATVVSKEKRNSFTWSFCCCISGQFCSFWVCVISFMIFPLCICGFLSIVLLPFMYFIPAPQACATGLLLHAVWPHWFIKCSLPSSAPPPLHRMSRPL